MSKKFSLILSFIISILIAQTTGFLGSIFTAPNIKTWYAFLEKPFFSPPDWLFAPAWIILYTLMGIAAFLVWQKRHSKGVKLALWLYLIHLGFNALWSVIFFGFKNPGLAFFEILILWVLILIVTVKFFKIEKAAGFLFIPYLFWVTFAAILNFAVWQLNI